MTVTVRRSSRIFASDSVGPLIGACSGTKRNSILEGMPQATSNTSQRVTSKMNSSSHAPTRASKSLTPGPWHDDPVRVKPKSLATPEAVRELVSRLQHRATSSGSGFKLKAGARTFDIEPTWSDKDFMRLELHLEQVGEKSQKFLSAMLDRKKNGDMGDANRPTWLKGGPYTAGNVFELRRTWLVWSMFSDYLDGYSLGDIADRLSSGSSNQAWTEPMVAQALFSPSVIGLWGGESDIPASEKQYQPERPSILELGTYRHVLELRSLRQAAPRRRGEQSLLSWLLRCSRCKGKIVLKIDQRQPKATIKCSTGCKLSADGKIDPRQIDQEILEWLLAKSDFLQELTNPLRVDREIVEHAMRGFSWSPANRKHSLEAAVRALPASKSGAAVSSGTPSPQQVLKDYLSKMEDKKTPASVKSEMRRRLQQILMKRVDEVFIGEASAALPKDRDYSPLYMMSADDLLGATADSTRRSTVRVEVQLVGEQPSGWAFYLPVLNAGRAPVAKDEGDHRQRSRNGLPPARPTHRVTIGHIDGWEEEVGSLPPPSDGLVLHPSSGSACAGAPFPPDGLLPCANLPEWAFYVPQAKGASWGVHFCACRLDSAALTLWKKLGRTPNDWPLAAQLALGMPLAFLSFHARLDLWLRSTLGAGAGNKAFARAVGYPLPGRPDDIGGLDTSLYLLQEKPEWLDQDKTANSVVKQFAEGILKQVAEDRPEWLPAVLAVGQIGHWARAAGDPLSRAASDELEGMDAPYSLWRLVGHDCTWQALQQRIGSGASGARQTQQRSNPRSCLDDALGASPENISQVPLHLHGSGYIADALLRLAAQRS